MIELKSWDEVKALNEEKIKEISLTEALEKVASVDEAVIKYVELDKSKLSNDIIAGLQGTDNIYTEVKVSEDKRSIKVKDSDGAEYSIWIDGLMYNN